MSAEPAVVVTTAPSHLMRCVKITLLAIMITWLLLVFWNSAKPLPRGTHFASQTSRLSESDVDLLYESPEHPNVEAQDLQVIDRAEQLLVLDRSPISSDIAQHLLARKRLRPTLKVVLITDPASAAFGGTSPQTFMKLEQAGVIVARVRLDQLRDSNPLYSGLWRMTFAWWSNPFDEAPKKATLAAWARMQNFKADRRQLVVADDGAGDWTASIAFTEAAARLVLQGSLARAMIVSELQIAAWSTDDDRLPAGPPMSGRGLGSIDARFLTEGAIQNALLDAIAGAGSGDLICLEVENLSERRLIAGLLRAAAHGAHLQVLLARKQMPNQPLAGELVRDGAGHIELRWYSSEMDKPHLNFFSVQHRDDMWLNLSSANFTRRDLDDLNLEAGVELRMPVNAKPARIAARHFAQNWSRASVEPEFADDSIVSYWQYRLLEATGLTNF